MVEMSAKSAHKNLGKKMGCTGSEGQDAHYPAHFNGTSHAGNLGVEGLEGELSITPIDDERRV